MVYTYEVKWEVCKPRNLNCCRLCGCFFFFFFFIASNTHTEKKQKLHRINKVIKRKKSNK